MIQYHNNRKGELIIVNNNMVERKKRINKIKRNILLIFFGLLFFSFILNIVLLVKVCSLDKKIKQLSAGETYVSSEYEA
ncbi:MAG: hypothetical protein IKQ71_03890 [Lachnospiraceae bacterium]|nr:hypothetical protein [Lachnospiraceae bacterium]